MKVYILTRWEWEDREKIVDCFSSVDKAVSHVNNKEAKICMWSSKEQPDERIVAHCNLGLVEYYIYELEL